MNQLRGNQLSKEANQVSQANYSKELAALTKLLQELSKALPAGWTVKAPEPVEITGFDGRTVDDFAMLEVTHASLPHKVLTIEIHDVTEDFSDDLDEGDDLDGEIYEGCKEVTIEESAEPEVSAFERGVNEGYRMVAEAARKAKPKTFPEFPVADRTTYCIECHKKILETQAVFNLWGEGPYCNECNRKLMDEYQRTHRPYGKEE